ncbi:MAG: hypothetical protein MUP16_02155 [Sedimentisphaerales bacterium]|nr:hypothetical protein [Sedimentisphaerales bacterium]
MDSKFLKDSLFSGMTSNAFKLGTVLTLGWFWTRIDGCSALYRGPSMERIDFNNLLAVAELNAGTISPPNYLPHNNSSTYFYVVRRVNGCGYEEHTIAAAVKVSIDADGNLAKSQPNKIFAGSIKQVDDDKAQLDWYYCPVGQKAGPARFKVYCDGGTGQIDYENPLATIDYEGRKFYSYKTFALDAGSYLFAISAEDAGGIESCSLMQFSIQLNTTNPDAIDILSAEAV